MENEVFITTTTKVWMGEDGIGRSIVLPDADELFVKGMLVQKLLYDFNKRLYMLQIQA